MNYKAPRGTHDLWGAQAQKLQNLEELSRNVFRRYDFTEIRTPMFEEANLFTRSIGETTDIVEKEMYVFTDRKGRRLALRPEGTASIVRAYLENQLPQNLPVAKLFYMGSMFRYERPQAGRYREFYQIGAEYFGNAAPSADAEIILLARDVLRSAGIPEMDIHVHTLGCPACRPVFRQKLVEFLSSRTDLCADCQRRIAVNPLRVLDCKIDGQKLEGFPEMMHCLCPACRVHFDQVQELLKSAGCSFRIDPRLVRGLDYYTRTIFEIRSSSLGSQDALAAGGRYDNLVEELGGPSTPAVGFALGSERVMLAAEKTNAARGIVQPQTVFIAVSGQTVAGDAFAVASRLREMPQDSAVWKTLVTGAAPVSVEGPFADRSLKSQLRLADRVGAVKVIIFGEEELKRGMVVIRDMKTQQQEERNLQSFV